jgi:D-alanyl-D-alanine carboxypeptidase
MRPGAWMLAACVVAAAIAVTVERTTVSKPVAARPELQRILDGLVAGHGRVAPGVTAFVAGPRGSWSGAAGLANVKTGEAMWPSAPMHLDSQTKTWVATVILQLVADRRMRLDDTVERWLPGQLPYGKRITVRELLDHTSGVVDQSSFDAHAALFIQRVHDPRLRSRLLHFWRRLATDPRTTIPTGVALRFMATLPLLWKPATEYHYSNIGYEIAGLIAAKAGGAPLGTLLDRRISQPLGLTSAAYVPGGEVGEAHPLDYSVGPTGAAREATDFYRADEGASGAMIANARDDARFFTSLMRGALLPPAQLTAMRTPSTANHAYGLGIAIVNTGCHVTAYEHGGASFSTTGAALVSADGERVAVILLNGNTSQGHSPGARSSDAALSAAKALFCAA